MFDKTPGVPIPATVVSSIHLRRSAGAGQELIAETATMLEVEMKFPAPDFAALEARLVVWGTTGRHAGRS